MHGLLVNNGKAYFLTPDMKVIRIKKGETIYDFGYRIIAELNQQCFFYTFSHQRDEIFNYLPIDFLAALLGFVFVNEDVQINNNKVSIFHPSYSCQGVYIRYNGDRINEDQMKYLNTTYLYTDTPTEVCQNSISPTEKKMLLYSRNPFPMDLSYLMQMIEDERKSPYKYLITPEGRKIYANYWHEPLRWRIISVLGLYDFVKKNRYSPIGVLACLGFVEHDIEDGWHHYVWCSRARPNLDDIIAEYPGEKWDDFNFWNSYEDKDIDAIIKKIKESTPLLEKTMMEKNPIKHKQGTDLGEIHLN